MRLAWLTDIHLNFVAPDVRQRFWESVGEQADAAVVTGDIGESHNILGLLQEAERWLARPVYFVLGNHDFYRGSIAETRAAVAELARGSKRLVYLTAAGVVPLSATTALVGHDGWADVRWGDFAGSDVILNDYLLIRELSFWRNPFELDKDRLRAALESLGDEAADHFQRVLSEAAGRYAQVIAATHVPPFRDAARYQDRTSDDNWLPHFSCQASGEAMHRVMQAHPQSQLLVLCGHTHGRGELQVSDNLRVWTGEATYGHPAVVRVLEVD